MFEKVYPAKAIISKDHIVLFNSALVHDKEVLDLKWKVDMWDSITKVPGFTKEMLQVAELMYSTIPYVVKKLNTILAEYKLAQVDHVLHAIYRLGNKYRTKEEKEETKFALKKCIMDVGGLDECTADAIRDQWPKCWKWTKAWVTFAHPFLDVELNVLLKLRNEIEVEPAYAEVHKAATFMVDLLMKTQYGWKGVGKSGNKRGWLWQRDWSFVPLSLQEKGAFHNPLNYD